MTTEPSFSDMLRYRVFGGVFAAPFPFPELRAEPGEVAADWTLRVADSRAPATDAWPIGEDELAPGISARLFRGPHGLRLEFDDTGTFDITDGGRAIVWYPTAGSDPDLVRVDILGRVLAASTHEQGTLCLHGSGVAIGGRGVGFLAPKGSGKSTLAMALSSGGARLLTDDTLPVDPTSGLAFPGVHSMRLWNDASERFAQLGQWRLGLSDKRTFDELPNDLVQHTPVPLGALYVLGAAAPASGDDVLVERRAMSPARATIALMQHSKLGALLGGSESRLVFDRCARVAESVPICELTVTRSLESLDRVADTIARWHS